MSIWMVTRVHRRDIAMIVHNTIGAQDGVGTARLVLLSTTTSEAAPSEPCSPHTPAALQLRPPERWLTALDNDGLRVLVRGGRGRGHADDVGMHSSVGPVGVVSVHLENVNI